MSAPIRMLLGLLKGAVIGGAVGIGFVFLLPQEPGLATWLSMLLAGTLVGIICGVPFWKKDQWITTIIKAIFGLGVGALANFLLDKFVSTMGQISYFVMPTGAAPLGDHWLGVAAFGALWGLLVDLDAGPGETGNKESSKAKQ